MSDAEPTPDGRYVVVRGRKWRASDPELPAPVRQRLVDHLMAARRDVASALWARDAEAEREARANVRRAKQGLGERGTPWWELTVDDRRRRWERALSDLDPG